MLHFDQNILKIPLWAKLIFLSVLERYFSNELTEKKSIKKMVARIEKYLKMMAFLGGKK